MISINIFSVIAAAASAFVLGFLFHGPVSGKLWMKLADIHPTGNEKLGDMIPQMLWNFLANIATACALAVTYAFIATSSLSTGPGVFTGIFSGMLVWLGFLVTSSSIEVIWMGRKVSLWLFEAGCSLVTMIVMGAIIASF